MRILFLTKGDKTMGSSRQRVWLLAEKLAAKFGVEYEVLSRPRRFSDAGKFLRKAGRADVIVVHKSLFPWDIVFLVLAAKIFWRVRLIYDLDDAEWIHSPLKTKLFLRFADAVFAGSHAILQFASKLNEGSVLVPTVLDHEIYKKHEVSRAPKETFTIGWVGYGKAHFLDGHFKPVRAALEEMRKKGFLCRLVIVGSQGYEPLKKYFSGVAPAAEAGGEVLFVDYPDWTNPESVPAAIEYYDFDIGLMPNSDTPFNRAKCGFKAIEYLACGVPVIASDVGEAKYIVQEGETGFLAKTESEWAEEILFLAKNPELRRHMGRAGMKLVAEKYSYEVILSAVFRHLATRSI